MAGLRLGYFLLQPGRVSVTARGGMRGSGMSRMKGATSGAFAW
ncbi:hypothetical protein [Mesorhizobium sp. BH1-1-5]|nr:hypothetical protein [Mesorhizobium sp. BH1-1-5]